MKNPFQNFELPFSRFSFLENSLKKIEFFVFFFITIHTPHSAFLIRQGKEKRKKFFKNLTFSFEMIIINCDGWEEKAQPSKNKKGGKKLWKKKE
jgi:hypothetical protein